MTDDGYLVRRLGNKLYKLGCEHELLTEHLASTELRESLAELEHIQWAHWTKYMLSNLSGENIQRWGEQIATPYMELSESDRDVDREWADKVLALLKIQ